MVTKHFFRSLVLATLLFVITPLTVGAQVSAQANLAGGSNAADYQPPTGNPQNNVGGVSQGQTGQNTLQKPEVVDQTALPVVRDLRVSGVTSQTNANTTKTEVTPEKNQTSTWVAIALGAAAVVAVVLLVSSASNRSKAKKEVPVAEVESESMPEVQSPKTAPVVTKKTTKRKKGKNKKTKRKR